MPDMNTDNGAPARRIKTDHPFMTAVMSGKGGAGKSVIACNLADTLAAQGNRCLLIDADWHFGNLHIVTNTSPKYDLGHLLAAPDDIEKTAVKLHDRFFLVASPAVSGVGAEFDPELYSHFVSRTDRFLRAFDYVIFDCASSPLEMLSVTAAAVDLNLLVLNPELTSIASGYGLFKYLAGTVKSAPVHVLVNRAESGMESEYIYRKFAVLAKRFLRTMPFKAGYLIEHEAIERSIREQKFIASAGGAESAAVQFLTLCKFITEERDRTAALQQINERSSIKSETVSADTKG